MSKKILIMGVGGCGSGFIVRCLENCGLDTGGYNSYLQHGPTHGEMLNGADPKKLDMPRVIKHLGGFMKNLNHHIDRFGWEVEHIFLAVTPYEFQIYKYQRRKEYSKEEADTRYKEALASGVLQLIERDHPFTIVRCPESILDPKYLYDKLRVVLPEDFTFEEFKVAHEKTISPKHKGRLIKLTKRLKYGKAEHD